MTPTCCTPAVGFNTLPELYYWIDWISGKNGYRFGANRLPSGSFDDPKRMAEDGWVSLDYQMNDITARTATVPRDKSETNRMIRMVIEPSKKEDLDKNVPFFDFPIAAIRSPAIPVQAKNVIRITVLVKRSIASNSGMGGIIVRDSIGGEQLQYRTAQPIPSFSRVVLYRKAPTDLNLTVTLGLAGYGEAYFDDLRVELIEANERPTRLAPATSPRNPRAGEPSSSPPLTPRSLPRRPIHPAPESASARASISITRNNGSPCDQAGSARRRDAAESSKFEKDHSSACSKSIESLMNFYGLYYGMSLVLRLGWPLVSGLFPMTFVPQCIAS